MSSAAEFKELTEAIRGAVPDRCQPCNRIPLQILFAARRVEDEGEPDYLLEHAKDDIAADLDSNCRLGASALVGCMGSAECGYGVLCRMPDKAPETLM